MRKRGQVALFIIIGIVLLISVVLVLVFRERLTVLRPDRIFPTETSALQTFIEGCTDTIARDGLALLGAQGGYIWLPPVIENNPLAYIDQGVKVPLWQYQQENRVPPQQLMEAHLSRYVTENLRSCLADLGEFKNQYTIVEKGELSTETTITPQLVLFRVTYPLDVINKEGKRITEIEDFTVEVPYKLKDIYDVAQSILDAEVADLKLEKMAIDLLALDSDIPLVGTDFSCRKKVWQVAEVERKVKELLRTNIPSLRVDYTNYIPVSADEPYVLNHYVWKVTEQPYPAVRASLLFDDSFPFRMAVRPSSGPLLKSNDLKGSGVASFLCLQQWKFTYDLQFPVLVTVEDAKNNFNLNFGFVVQVKSNRPNREQLTAQLPFFEPSQADDETYCANTYGNYDMIVNTFDNVSDPDVGETHLPIHHVNISFTCLKYTCEMGQSRYESGGAVARLRATFPYCVNGVLRAKKPGYKPYQQFVTTTSGKEVSAYLTPIKTIEQYNVVKHILTDAGLTGARPLDAGEKAFISLKYVNNRTLVHESWGGYPTERDVSLHPLELLAEGNFPYRLEVFVTDERNGLRGGYQGVWEPAWAELQTGKRLEFHVVEKIGTEQEMIAFMTELEKKSEDTLLQPVIR